MEIQQPDSSLNCYFCFVLVLFQFPEELCPEYNKVDWERPAENWMKLSFN